MAIQSQRPMTATCKISYSDSPDMARTRTRLTNHPNTFDAPLLTVMNANRGMILIVRTQTQGVPSALVSAIAPEFPTEDSQRCVLRKIFGTRPL